MGMYDVITHKIKCPKCETDIEIEEQIKWTNDCVLNYYKVGDKIDASDGEYDFATWVRPELFVKCKNCGEKINYKVIVKDGILSEIKITHSERNEGLFTRLPNSDGTVDLHMNQKMFDKVIDPFYKKMDER